MTLKESQARFTPPEGVNFGNGRAWLILLRIKSGHQVCLHRQTGDRSFPSPAYNDGLTALPPFEIE